MTESKNGTLIGIASFLKRFDRVHRRCGKSISYTNPKFFSFHTSRYIYILGVIHSSRKHPVPHFYPFYSTETKSLRVALKNLEILKSLTVNHE